MEIELLGIDLAEHVFQLHGADLSGRAVHRSKVARGVLTETVHKLHPQIVAMEACSSAHHWARRFIALGIEVRLISPQYVSPFVKTNKNDRNDAEANVEAAGRPTMRFVSIKSVEQEYIQAVHRMRAILVRQWALVSLTATDAALAFSLTTTPTRSLRGLSLKLTVSPMKNSSRCVLGGGGVGST